MNWRDRARDLANATEKTGDLRSAHWRAAIEQTPRHQFVPVFYRNDGGSPTVWRPLSEEDGDTWMERIYADTTLVTHLDPATAERSGEGWTGTPTSSSTQPSLMVRMLEALAIQPDHTVLELGTATGYNAALICHRLATPQQLTTADLDSELTSAAEARLHELGYDPRVVTCDATKYRWPEAYDRIVATCALPRIEESLRTALAPGGRLIANIMPPLSGGLVVLTADHDGVLQGSFHSDGGFFMAAHHDASGYAPPADGTTGTVGGGSVQVPLEAFSDYRFQFVLAAHLPGADLEYGVDDETGHSTRRLVMPDGSWCQADYDGDRPLSYRERGRSTWAVVAQCWKWFTGNGIPKWDRFGLTVTSEAHLFWFETPDQVLASF